MKIAFLFLIRESLYHPELWETYFKSALDSNEDYSIYIHYAKSINIGWFNQFKLSNTVPTKWGHISLVEAMNVLLENALKDKENQMFVFLSESCIPVKPMNHVKNNLDTNFSYFNFFPSVFPRADPALKYFSRDEIKGASQWCILNRKHAEYLLKIRSDTINFFSAVFAADEICYSTFICSKFKDEIKDTMTTCVIWSNNSNKNFKKKKGLLKNTPNEYILFDINELDYILKTDTIFFLRKITKNCVISYDYHNSFPGKYAQIQLYSTANDRKQIEDALKLCKLKKYGGFVNFRNRFYFKKQTVNELTDNAIPNSEATLITLKTIDEYLMDKIKHKSNQINNEKY
jgi:hypothetical protein